ncbi:hypothetical protein [Clostridium carboxidivorans]|nr:hypothetical protein [Clostridium carboxidivorans]
MLTLIILVTTITLIIVTPVISLAICKIAKELRKDDKDARN